MHLEFTHTPDYFFFSQLLVHHLESHITKQPDEPKTMFDLKEIYQLFREDFAATTTNLESILNISCLYKVETLEGDQPFIQNYRIDAKQNNLWLEFNKAATERLVAGYPLIEPNFATT